MRRTCLSTTLMMTGLLATAAIAGAARASYVTPAEPGIIYTVIDFPRELGQAQPTAVRVTFGDAHRVVRVRPSYRCVESTPSGFVFKLRHRTSEATPLTIATPGTVVRGPYQGDPPLELLHPCYKLVL
jgi:hypothetical protein